jgi:hypothetical protein
MLRSSFLKFPFFLFLCVSIAVFQTYVFQLEILGSAQSSQSDFFIDVFYYLHLGEVIANKYIMDSESFFGLINELSPNRSTVGIVFINTVYGLVFDSIYLKVIAHSLIFSTIIYFSFPPIKRIKSLMFVFVFGGLLSYILLPSKESVLILAFAFLMCFLIYRKTSLLALSTLLLLLSRPETLIILCLSYLIYFCQRPRYFLMLMVAFSYVYFGLGLRELLFEAAMFNQGMAEQLLDSFQCQYGFLNACLSTIDSFESTILNRLILTGSLPLKWGYDLFIYSIGGAYSGLTFYLKVSQLLPLLYLIFKWDVFLLFIKRTQFRFVLIFVSLYIGGYMSIIFYQASRPLSMVITLALLSFYFVKMDSFLRLGKAKK